MHRSRKKGPIIKTKKQAIERDPEIIQILELGHNF